MSKHFDPFPLRIDTERPFAINVPRFSNTARAPEILRVRVQLALQTAETSLPCTIQQNILSIRPFTCPSFLCVCRPLSFIFFPPFLLCDIPFSFIDTIHLIRIWRCCTERNRQYVHRCLPGKSKIVCSIAIQHPQLRNQMKDDTTRPFVQTLCIYLRCSAIKRFALLFYFFFKEGGGEDSTQKSLLIMTKRHFM